MVSLFCLLLVIGNDFLPEKYTVHHQDSLSKFSCPNAFVNILNMFFLYNKREKDHKSQLILKMKDKTTVIIKPDGKDPITFTFDYSYWSHDGYKVREDGYLLPEEGSSYTDQVNVGYFSSCSLYSLEQSRD
jgi:hypothetical protein